LGYVPESKTDFIFAVVGEQTGLIGTTALIALLSFIGYRFFRISRDSHDLLGRFIAMGIYVFFAFSCFQNIGMTLGIMPVTGIPLPMISYGGSSAIVFSIAGGAVLAISKRVK
jgi:rod shape determining protein RodA